MNTLRPDGTAAFVPLLALALLSGVFLPDRAVGASLPDGRWTVSLVMAVAEGHSSANEDESGNETSEEGRNDRKTTDRPVVFRRPVKNEVADLEMILERSSGKWIPLFSDKNRIFGLIESADNDGNVHVQVLFDAMGRSGNLFKTAATTALVAYSIKLQAAADGTVTGTWTSPTAGKGNLRGRILPMPAASHPASAPGEHPRFLLRTDQIPALKAKAATPWGRSMLEHLDKKAWSRSSQAVGLGLLYRITGDKTYAKRAQELVLLDMTTGWWDVIGPIHDPPHKVMEAVYAWDLIHDTCDPEFTRRLLTMARGHLRFLDNMCDIDRGNGHPHSNWSAQFQTGVGMAALALVSDPSNYQEPEPETGIPILSPPKDPTPEGLPVFPYDADARQLTEWLVAGPFDIGLGNDGLAEIGGAANAKVYDGLRFPITVKEKESKEVNDKDGVHYIHQKNAKTFLWSHVHGDDGQPLTRKIEGAFRKFPKEWICSSNTYAGWPGSMDLRIASGYRSYRTFYLAAALRVPSPVTVNVHFQNQQRDDPCVYIAGRKFRVNDMVHLEAGIYPVMYPVTYTTFISSHGRDEAIYEGFQLLPATPEQKAKMLAHRQAVKTFHDVCTKTLAGTPYADYWPHLWLAYSRAKMDAWATHAISERGWNIAGDCYTLPSLQALAPFAHAYASASGFTLASPGNLGWVLPHQVAKTIFAENGAFASAYGRGGGPYGPMPYARCFTFVDTALQPAVGWAAHRTLALALAGKLTSENLVVDEFNPLSAAFALLYWPQPEEIKSPEGIIPLTIGDHDRCCWTFRNRFKDGDDAVTSIAGFIHGGGDWGDVASGEFRLAALGNEWAVRGACGSNPANVVQLAEEVVAKMRLGHLVYRETSRKNPDGTTSVTLDLQPMLSKNEWRETYGPAVGSRTFLTDFSGVCGAPVLVVVQDQIPPLPRKPAKTPVDAVTEKTDASKNAVDDAGLNEDILPGFAKKRPPAGPYDPPENTNDYHRWQFVTDPTHKVAMRQDGFTLSATNGATLNATVLRPAKVRMWQESLSIPMELNYRYDHRGGKLPRTVITAGGEESFLVVMTVQRGAVPKVSLADGIVSVGDRKLRVLDNGVEMVP